MRRVGGQAVRHLLGAVVAALVLAGLGIAGLGWALNAHPVAAPWLAARIQQEADRAFGPGALQIGSAVIAWNGFHGGIGNPLVVKLRDVALRQGVSSTSEAREIAVNLDVWPLLHGLLRPRAVRASGVSVTLANLPASTGATPLETLRSLASVRLLATQPSWLNNLQSLAVRNGELRAGPNETPVLVRLDADLSRTAEDQIQIEAEFNTLPADLAKVSGDLAAAARLKAPVSVQAGAMLARDGLPLSAHIRLGAGEGSLFLTETPVPFLGSTASAAWSRAGGLAGIIMLAVQPHPEEPPTNIRVEAAIPPGDGPLAAHGKLSMDQANIADLGALWPAGFDRNARRWTLRNLTAGTARDAHLDYALSIAADGKGARLTQLSGSVSGEDLTIHWLRPIPPVEHVGAVLTLLDPDRLTIALGGGLEPVSGTPDSLRLETGNVLISGLSKHDQIAAIQIEGAGSIPAALGLLAHPRLHLLSDHPAKLKNPRGEVAADIAVKLPLVAGVKIDEMDLRASARLNHLSLGDVVAQRSLSDASLQLAINANEMSFSGTGQIADIPGRFSGTIDFRPGPPGQIVQRITARTRTDMTSLSQFGLDTAELASGEADLEARYLRRRDGSASVSVNADLEAAVLRVDVLGWRKKAGEPAAVTARIMLDRAGRLSGVDDIDAAGAGFAVTSRARPAPGGVTRIDLYHLVLGNTQARGTMLIGAGGKEIRMNLDGPVIDLRSWFTGPKVPGTGRSAETGPWMLSARFARALLAHGRPITNLALQANGQGAEIRSLALQADISGTQPVQARVTPQRNGRALSISAADGGELLRSLGALDCIEGGKLHVEGQFEDDRAGHPLRGIAELDDFRLRGAPLLGKALQAASLYGLMQAVDGPGMNFNHLVAPFAYTQGTVTLARARAFNPSLGLTAEGRIDLETSSLQLKGTIVPAYYLNTLPGRLPLIGPLFSPERAGGLIAARYVASGFLANPAIRVNPLAALTPGFLRGVFGK